MRPGDQVRPPGEPVEQPLDAGVSHRLFEWLTEEVAEHLLGEVGLRDRRALVEVVGVADAQLAGVRDGPRPLRLRPRATAVQPAPHMHMRALDLATESLRIGQQVHVLAAQPESLADPHTGAPQQEHQEAIPRVPGDVDQPGDLLDRQPLDPRVDAPELEDSRTDRAVLVVLAQIEPLR
ncbi:hypothetical protein ADL12_23140 [Streptomyces regalis]|uniref:Uncharacterized protein n=1 Tax=Streptomyces regalis TaxID=68262 RepID=A0A101JTE7_9ACTN|nr:hypothetical protein ADL12_23140 [Streptomyces regalis]